MNAMIAGARAVHFASTMLLFGGAVFALAASAPLRSRLGSAAGAAGPRRPLRSLALVCAGVALAASVVSGIIWLVVEAAAMGGVPLSQAVGDGTLSRVVRTTLFGRVWLVRLGLAIAIAALLYASQRSGDDRGERWKAASIAAIAGAYLGTLAWSGHGVGELSSSYLQLSCDVIHLLAAGAWIGALPCLVCVLGYSLPPGTSATIARRFSALGIVAVGALIASGIANTWYLVGDIPGLIGTGYGRLLLAKLALFAAMVTLAAINRASLVRLTRAGAWNRDAALALRRNAWAETILGMAIVAIVGALGVMVPAAHQPPQWPFDWTLSWQAPQRSLGIGIVAIGAAVASVAAVMLALRGSVRRRGPAGVVALCAIAVAGTATAAWLVAVPAYPTSYAVAPERYTTAAIARGAALYAQHCNGCHGASGHGDGPDALSLPIIPADLTAHGSDHRPGEIYWWIARGIPRTPMPAFAHRLSDTEIWDLVQFLHAQSDAAAARLLDNRAQPWHVALAAPDFAFDLPDRGQESLRRASDPATTLLVLYTLPQSAAYLRELGAASSPLKAIGVRVIAIPMNGSATGYGAEARVEARVAAIAPSTAGDVAAAYAMYARNENAPRAAAPAQIDYLIDKQGYLRARWLGVPDSPAARIADAFDQADVLNRERPRAPPSAHAH